jgi:hypothetical protein
MARGGGFDTGQVQIVNGPPRHVGSVPVVVVARLAQLQETCHVARVVGSALGASQSKLVHVQKFIRVTRISQRLDPIRRIEYHGLSRLDHGSDSNHREVGEHSHWMEWSPER